jgi:hypothetical protein
LFAAFCAEFMGFKMSNNMRLSQRPGVVDSHRSKTAGFRRPSGDEPVTTFEYDPARVDEITAIFDFGPSHEFLRGARRH